ncbi:YopX family protein [Streptococcus gallolyticus subsp. gallolyticus]|uniref:YopX family protein n=1 Tax=Streptococcus gallolyticus TaxID=315405 RepID=UPI002284A4B0|nr:YopX family protein [Streptococcus gallolyticus]MCY7157501.1 YopX family protein [Streptococcus gallolyticus subsp. gallolyticus]
MTIPKFRVYDKVECMMITTSDYEDLSDLFCFLKADADTGYYSEPMQSTGLKDKNGKEIYEGDIVLIYGEKISKVFYSQGSFCVDILNGGTPLHGFSPKQLEVIGNIWENKEFLEEE